MRPELSRLCKPVLVPGIALCAPSQWPEQVFRYKLNHQAEVLMKKQVIALLAATALPVAAVAGEITTNLFFHENLSLVI